MAHILQMKRDGASADDVQAECMARRASLQAVPSGLQAFGGSRALGGGGDYLSVSYRSFLLFARAEALLKRPLSPFLPPLPQLQALTAYEAMHTEDLGVLLWIIKVLPAILAAYAASPDYPGFNKRHVNKILAEINLRMRCLPRTEGQRLPSNTNNTYWCEVSGQIPAAEHRCVMMVSHL